MVGTSAGTAMVVAIVLIGSVLGIGAGGLTVLVLRQPWTAKGAVGDAVLAAAVVVFAAYVITAIDIARGDLQSRVVPRHRLTDGRGRCSKPSNERCATSRLDMSLGPRPRWSRACGADRLHASR